MRRRLGREAGLVVADGTRGFLRQACERLERLEVGARRGDHAIVHKRDEVSDIGLITAAPCRPP